MPPPTVADQRATESLSHPGDSYSYDIFSQAGEAVWDDSARAARRADAQARHRHGRVAVGGPSDDLHRRRGAARSTSTTATWCTAGSARRRQLSQAPQTAITVPTSVQFRDRPQCPGLRVRDGDRCRGHHAVRPADQHEPIPALGGGGGLALRLLRPLHRANRHRERSGRHREPAGDAEPTEQVAGLGSCAEPINTSGTHWVLDAADLVAQPVGGQRHRAAHPSAHGGHDSAPGQPVVFATDANGNVLGGVRTPQIDAPVATLSGVGNSGRARGILPLFGRTIPFSATQLAALYPTHAQFVLQWDLATLSDLSRLPPRPTPRARQLRALRSPDRLAPRRDPPGPGRAWITPSR